MIKIQGGLYSVETEKGIYFCKAKGIFRKEQTEPVTGDFVDIKITHEKDREGVIVKIHPRKNALMRPKVSNVDQSVLVFSVGLPPVNFDLLDRLIILSEQQNLEIIIIINKMDTIETPEDSAVLAQVQNIYEKIGYPVIPASALTGLGMSVLKKHLKNKVSVFAGPSGVGKSSLTNFLQSAVKMDVEHISAKGKRGRHTTRYSHLIEINEGYIVDSPGFSSLTFNFEGQELAGFFREFEPYFDNCRFTHCSHISEPDCGIKDELGMNISMNRYNRYKDFYREIKSR